MRILSAVILVMMIAFLSVVTGESRFTDNGYGTISDRTLGDVWQKCSAGQNEIKCTGTASKMTWSDAKTYCGKLALAGNKWRLPDIVELINLVDYGKKNAAINISVFPGTVDSHYWTATELAGQGDSAWTVNFNVGYVATVVKSQTAFVRCIIEEKQRTKPKEGK